MKTYVYQLQSITIDESGVLLPISCPVNHIPPACLPFSPARSLDSLKVVDEEEGSFTIHLHEWKGYMVEVNAPTLLKAERVTADYPYFLLKHMEYSTEPMLRIRKDSDLDLPDNVLKRTGPVYPDQYDDRYIKVLNYLKPERILYTSHCLFFVYKDIVVQETPFSNIATRVFLRPQNVEFLADYVEYRRTAQLRKQHASVGLIAVMLHNDLKAWGGKLKTIMRLAAEGAFKSEFDKALFFARMES